MLPEYHFKEYTVSVVSPTGEIISTISTTEINIPLPVRAFDETGTGGRFAPLPRLNGYDPLEDVTASFLSISPEFALAFNRGYEEQITLQVNAIAEPDDGSGIPLGYIANMKGRIIQGLGALALSGSDLASQEVMFKPLTLRITLGGQVLVDYAPQDYILIVGGENLMANKKQLLGL